MVFDGHFSDAREESLADVGRYWASHDIHKKVMTENATIAVTTPCNPNCEAP